MHEQLIKDYSYSITGDILEIYLIDLYNNTIILATNIDCVADIDKLCHDMIEDNNYILL